MTWKDVYRRAFELALDGADVGDGAEQLLALDVGDRADFDAARFHYLGQLGDSPDDPELRAASEYVREAIWRGDIGEVWKEWGHVDPWEIAHYRSAA